ncbi:hypothetical protein AA13595_0769 [Gluconacetobacter johannae DSM 13595]|nr:hypothetical protein AA13595_0769 [Gluconacetobacter johannae DSM 13595]
MRLPDWYSGLTRPRQEKAAGETGQIPERLIHADLVILDELGYLPFGTSGGAPPWHSTIWRALVEGSPACETPFDDGHDDKQNKGKERTGKHRGIKQG